ncbi:pleckstrin homology domain-containing family G member 1 isoform X2 [Ambystoma mexicanum]|uniref:pleckstrin homology domain-containing family G member 1 isoform X2 n=1 Tax=Ambystoma mexicanum TaxID=8296 RepID=UPI0037E9C802
MPTDDYHFPLDVLPTVTEACGLATGAGDLQRGIRYFRYGESKNMELSDSDRPVSFSSTSSSASSRDSHCSFGSRMTLASNHLLGSFQQDRDSGAIKLELVPARQLAAGEPHRKSERKQPWEQESTEKWQGAQKKTVANGSPKHSSESLVIEPTPPKPMYVDRVVQEILQTERTYVQDLKSIVEDYLVCISDQSRLSLGTEERSALFGNIRDIYLFNSELLQDLENCDNDPVAIAECFVSKSEDFHIYTQYCTNYPRSVAVLTDCMRNKMVAKFFRDRQEVLQHSLPLGSYLLKPVQRILKYHLLLHEIATRLEKDIEGYDVVLEAIDTMQRVAWHINDMKRKHEHAIRLQEIQSLLTNWKGPDLTSYGELVLEGTFRIQRAKNERTLFLFDRLLLITKKREETFTYKAHILCCNLMLVEVIPKEPLSFSLFHYKNPKLQHTVQAKSQQDKRLWILHLKRLILENHPAKIPAKAKQAILEMDAIHHPGFYYSPEEENHSPSNSKEGVVPRRVRRKSEMSPDLQKRISMEGALLSQAAKLASSEALLASGIRNGVRQHSQMVNQSRESLGPSYSSDLEESHQLGVSEQTDADDEEESEQFMQQNSQQKIKGGRKRLNSQSSENVEKRRSVNLGTCQGQLFREPSEESSQVNSERSFSSTRSQSPRFNTAQNTSVIMNILGRGSSERNIWTDHQIRQALFPSRRTPQEHEDDDDYYQMFVPSTSAANLDSTRVHEERSTSSRPCSWHMGLMEQSEISSSFRRIVRRASSVGESKTGPNGFRGRVNDCNQFISQRHVINYSSRTEVGSTHTYAQSSEELTIDDIDHVYDNISYEDLKMMGFALREENELLPQTARNSVPRSNSKMNNRRGTNNERQLFIEGSSLFGNGGKMFVGDAHTSSSHELRIEEESIYDSIGLPDQPLVNSSCHPPNSSKQSTFIEPETDLACYDNFGRFVSEESLQFSEDETLDHRVPLNNDYLNLVDSSSNSDSLSHKSAADKLSEEVDEIWNDLENYIKKNEEKSRDHLLASFPVSRDDVQERSHAGRTPELRKEVEYSLSTLSLPETPRITKHKVARLSGASMRYGEGHSGKDELFVSLHRPSLASETTFVESPYKSANIILSSTEGEGTDLGTDLADRAKNKVFLMARQYSQKIKKANQLLKLKSPEQEQPLCRQPNLNSKDLAAILEEKKQGGAAIGARIAEYSQLYDQIQFREMPPKTHKDACSSPKETSSHFTRPLPQSTSSQHSQFSSECSQMEEWLLDSTYSNGELANFFARSDEQAVKSKHSSSQLMAKSAQKQLTCSAPSLKICTHSQDPTQRWSTFANQSSKPNLCHESTYNSLGKKESSTNTPQYNRSQSSSSVVANRPGESIHYHGGLDHKPLIFSKNVWPDRHRDAYAAAGPSLCEKSRHTLEDRSDITLQDSQKILVVNRNSSLNAQIATMNYFSNFKDKGGSDDNEDEDDYVEIKSDDEDRGLDAACNKAKNSDCKSNERAVPPQALCNTGMSSSFSTPCTPAKSPSSKHASSPQLNTYSDTEKLNDYLWRVPSPTQQNIVQSLREKFQCLSSSSFA